MLLVLRASVKAGLSDGRRLCLAVIAFSFPADRSDGDIFLQKFKRCDVTTQRSSGFSEEVFVMCLDKSPREQGQRR